ncbi:mannose-6-phosphate isomerase, class I [Actinocatenispora thailandica]|uniref:mannose-6-phosphate isomerase n=1 Tax=Actinocatenispora thailandica TaxID=227318 RepID=A0A7R7DTB7_9ACTN|nr:mannose-6-phosphate isomerase, class I [Actinocatenispora thailandica]BCJ37438.1 mannose-6-phosphate isomerase, class I [Actinocatenispora thailandica]
MRALTGRIQPYAWGSRAAIAAIQGRPVPSGTPEAELWLGAHPAAPSTVDDGRSLVDVIADDPVGTLGPARRFERLPFLLKLLAADQPLSLQVHPNSDQARAGFDAESAAGVPLTAPERNYKDPYHKPEMIVALTDFDALCGFAPPQRSAELLAGLAVPALEPVVSALRSDEAADGLRAAVAALLAVPVRTVEEAVRAASGRTGAAPGYRLMVELARRHPGDPGVLVAVLLNQVRLRPGQALYAPAGCLHAYLAGVGVELMAASDNVLRGGLTPKHVDVPELLRLLRYEPAPPPIADPVPVAGGLDSYPQLLPGVAEFALSVARVGGPHRRVELAADGPRVLFCVSGRVLADDGAAELSLGPGEAAFVAADRRTVQLSGYGEVFQATTA